MISSRFTVTLCVNVQIVLADQQGLDREKSEVRTGLTTKNCETVNIFGQTYFSRGCASSSAILAGELLVMMCP